MSDQQITCAECSSVFVFSAAEQQFYTERGLASPPKRCKGCRQARKAAQGDAGGARGPSRDRPPRFGASGNANEYRSPMSNGSSYGANGRPGARSAPRAGGFNAPPPGERGRVDRARPQRGDGFPRQNGFNGPATPRPGGFAGGAGGGGGRSAPRPVNGESRGPAPSRGTRPGEGGNRPPRPPPRENREARPPRPEPAAEERPARARPERPRYDVTCAECGTQAQVPFKPIEGRQVFCQPCYKARKGSGVTPEADATADKDSGIVE